MSDHSFPPLSNIQHPIEGIFYLIVIAVAVRWRWPRTWNKFLESISAKTVGSLGERVEDSESPRIDASN